MEFYDVKQQELEAHAAQAEKSGRLADKMSVNQALKHYVRDWADEGAKERDEAFPCILTTLEDIKARAKQAAPIRVLLPGSGVGRLGHDVANLQGII